MISSLSTIFTDGKRELVTVIEAISAAGACHHPTILLKGKTFQSRWLKYKIQGASYGNMERGWTTDAEAITWLEGFLKATKPYEFLSILSSSTHPTVRSDPNAWRLLLIDGHGSHKTMEFLTLCLSNKVNISRQILCL